MLEPLTYDLVVTAGEKPYKAPGMTVDDRSLLHLQERGTGNVSLWTAPGVGETRFAPETVGDIENAREQHRIESANWPFEGGRDTPKNVIVNNDLLLLEVESAGLEGLLMESIQRRNGMSGVAAFLNRENDHLITEAFFGTTNLHPDGKPVLGAPTIQTNAGAELPAAQLSMQNATTGVIAGTDDAGNLESVYILAQIEQNKDIMDATRWGGKRKLEFGMHLETEFRVRTYAGKHALSVIGTDEDTSLNSPDINPLTETAVTEDNSGEQRVVSNESERVTWEFREDRVRVERVDDVLAVPSKESVEISGDTAIAAGSNLTVTITTNTSHAESAVQTYSTTVKYRETAVNTWSIRADFDQLPPGAEFSVAVTRPGYNETLTRSHGPIDGIVTRDPSVPAFSVRNWTTDEQNVVVDTFNTTQGGYIAIETQDGEQIGWSNFLGFGEHTNVSIPLESSIEENQTLTAVAYRTRETAYTDESGSPITTSADITEVRPAFFAISDLEVDETESDLVASANITNTGDLSGTQNISMQLDYISIASTEITLEDGESTSVTLTTTTESIESGTRYLVSIASTDDHATESRTIAENATQTPTKTGTETTTQESTRTATTREPTATKTATPTATESDGDGPGFGVVVALLAVLGACLVTVRRHARK